MEESNLYLNEESKKRVHKHTVSFPFYDGGSADPACIFWINPR
jgi:hypothetical protein